MNYPVVELIAQEIETTLNAVKTCNGYNFDLYVQRAKRKFPSPTHLLGIIYQDDPDEIDNEIYNKDGWMQPFYVDVFILPAETDNRPIDQFINCVVSDMTKALTVDSTRGGRAIDTIIRPYHIFQEVAGELCGFEFHIDVQYRTSYTNPEQVAV